VAARDIDIALHVERSDGHLHGTARIQDEPAREFSGWLGLFAALEALLAERDEERGI
jgi:hypothetical protein